MKKYFEKDFLKLMTSSIFGRTMQNLKNHRDIRLVATEKRRSCLVTNVSEPNYHTAKCFSETPLETEMDKTKRNEWNSLSRCINFEHQQNRDWHDDLKPNYCNRLKLCHMDMESFIVLVKPNNVYGDPEGDIDNKFGTPN